MNAAPDGRITAIGLTGGIGSGKSTVAHGLVALGAVLVDTDAIARALTVPGGGAMAALAAAFGERVVAPDGALDRDRMREIAFSDPGAKARLEGILHPLIGAEAARRAAEAAGRTVVYDVPLLVESARWRRRVQRVLVVDCSEQTQVARVIGRSGWSEAAVRAVIASQAPRAIRRAAADAVVFNEAIDIGTLHRQLADLWALWGLQASPGPVEQSP